MLCSVSPRIPSPRISPPRIPSPRISPTTYFPHHVFRHHVVPPPLIPIFTLRPRRRLRPTSCCTIRPASGALPTPTVLL